MAQIELPDEVATAIADAQQKMQASLAESQAAAAARSAADQASAAADAQLLRANQSAQDAHTAALAAWEQLRVYLQLPAPTP